MGLIDLFQKTRETSMELKPQEEETTNKVVTCKGCGAELKADAYGKNLYVCPNSGRYGRLLARTRIRQSCIRRPDSLPGLCGQDKGACRKGRHA